MAGKSLTKCEIVNIQNLTLIITADTLVPIEKRSYEICRSFIFHYI